MARLVAGSPRLDDPRLKHLASLDRASLGQWVGASRVGASAPEALPACEVLTRELVAQGIVNREALRELRRTGLPGFFAVAVRYRNEVLGHGAQRDRSFYAGMEHMWQAAALEVVGARSWLDGGSCGYGPREAWR